MLIVLRVKTVKPPFASPMAAYVCIQLKPEKEKTTKCKKHVSCILTIQCVPFTENCKQSAEDQKMWPNFGNHILASQTLSPETPY